MPKILSYQTKQECWRCVGIYPIAKEYKSILYVSARIDGIETRDGSAHAVCSHIGRYQRIRLEKYDIDLMEIDLESDKPISLFISDKNATSSDTVIELDIDHSWIACFEKKEAVKAVFTEPTIAKVLPDNSKKLDLISATVTGLERSIADIVKDLRSQIDSIIK